MNERFQVSEVSMTYRAGARPTTGIGVVDTVDHSVIFAAVESPDQRKIMNEACRKANATSAVLDAMTELLKVIGK
jgi:hypothetical protein